MTAAPFPGYSLTVHLPATLDRPWPVGGGVPFAEGAIAPGTSFALRNSDGKPLPLQTTELTCWPDGSVAWIKLDFIVPAGAGGVRRYRLEHGESPATCAPAAIGISHRATLVLVDEAGEECRARLDKPSIETAGPCRRTVAWQGDFVTAAGRRLCQWRLRATTWAGTTACCIEPAIFVDPDSGIFLRFKALRLHLDGTGGDRAEFGLANDEPVSAVSLYQLDDEQYRLDGGELTAGQAAGWLETGGLAVAVRDFWQQWPKALSVGDGVIGVGLLPAFEVGAFAHVQPDHKYQYLFDGDCYRLRDGQARRWHVWLDAAGNGAALSALAAAPPVPVLDPAQAVATGVWGPIVPGNREYETWAAGLFDAYRESIRYQRDYGAMNWGDWYGERYINWGNHEYDTPWQLFMQYAATGDPRYFHEAELCARHMSEVDTIHHVNADLDAYFRENWPELGALVPSRPGMVHEHTVGHVSGVYSVDEVRQMLLDAGVAGPKPYACMDPYNLGHIWTTGMARAYCLTGDPFLKETVEAIGLHLTKLVEEWRYPFMDNDHCGRTTGWPLLALAGAYEISPEPRYLAAMKRLVDEALAKQDPNCGGWLWDLPRGHCFCAKPHVGMAGFITAILINGLSAYYYLTRDERLVGAIERATTFLNRDTWDGDAADWRYTSCPATQLIRRIGVVIQAQVNAWRIARHPAHLHVLRQAWTAKFAEMQRDGLPSRVSQGVGKTYGVTLYGSLEAACVCATEPA